jgi:CubicO group peptidase (beta-lactamase class C family)
MQMILQGGFYGGRQMVSDTIVKKFYAKQYMNNRRALGWDMLDKKVENASLYASERSFGHTGFTGGMVWADPDYDLIYIFLSNRIYPDEENTKLIKNNTRTRIQDLIYRSILSEESVIDQDL